ncbi:MAG TPA: hypothetical protein VF132_14790 [Rudaea sp.]
MRLALLLFAALPAVAGAQTYYLDVINTAPSSLVALAVAPAGTHAFRPIVPAGGAVHGGGDAFTIALDRNDGCLRDLRLSFADGRVLERNGFDVCKFRSFHTGRYWRDARWAAPVSAQR